MKLKSSDSMVEKVRKVHDWMVYNFSYDYLWYDWDKGVSLSDTQASEAKTHKPSKAYWVFENKLAICSGYSAVFKAFMDELGFECITVSSSQMNHAWNMIKMDDGNWYHVDVTWDDPGRSKELQYQWVLGSYRSSHLLRNDDGITAQKHYGWTASAPKATGTKYENEVYHELSYDRSEDDEFYENGRIKKAKKYYSNQVQPAFLEFYETGIIAKKSHQSDSGTTSIYEYNSSGQKIKYTSINDNRTVVTEYNDAGKPLKESIESNNGSKRTITYTYNSKGSLTKKVEESPYQTTVTEYNSAEIRIKETIDFNDGSKKISEYNDLGIVIGSIRLDSNGSKTIFEYNNGYQIKSTAYNTNGTKTIAEYDENGRTISYTSYDSDGVITYKMTTEYYTDGRTQRTSFEPNGQKSVSEFNSDGKQIKSISYNADGTINSETEYNPSNGYPLKSTYYCADGTKKVSEYDGTSYTPIKTTYYDENGKPYDPYDSYWP